MILVLGGTTEGRKVVSTLDKGGKPFFYSTRSDLQRMESHNAKRITGALDRESMAEFCRKNDVRLIIDAAHPFASQLHSTVVEVGRECSIPLVRFERKFPPHDQRFIWCDSYENAVEKLKDLGVESLLALTGVQTISKLRGYWKTHKCFFRILNRDESLVKAREMNFPEDRLVYYEKDGGISHFIDELHPEAIITKESGETGGFSDKVEEAISRGLKVFVVKRPALPAGFLTVTGEYGLRKVVEKVLPEFFGLRSGFTTGSCATAAAKAALLALVNGEDSEYVWISLPNGEEMCLPVENCRVIDGRVAEAVVVKDGGDDPDVTHGCRIVAKVMLADHGDIRFFGGEGVGKVCLPGVGLEIGEPAINPVPRKMMRNELLRIYPKGCDVTISVPGGAEIALQTFNPRIGIEGGISIIGTSGVVMPFSNEAFVEAIKREMEVAKASGCGRIVLNSGARSEKAVKMIYPELPPVAFVHYGNAIGESLEIANDLRIEKLTVGLMIGKAVKLAEGNLDTHSHKVTMNRSFLSELATRCGCGNKTIEIIEGINMARELWTALSDDDASRFFPALLSLCREECRKVYMTGELTVMLITDSGIIKYRDGE